MSKEIVVFWRATKGVLWVYLSMAIFLQSFIRGSNVIDFFYIVCYAYSLRKRNVINAEEQ